MMASISFEVVLLSPNRELVRCSTISKTSFVAVADRRDTIASLRMKAAEAGFEEAKLWLYTGTILEKTNNIEEYITGTFC